MNVEVFEQEIRKAWEVYRDMAAEISVITSEPEQEVLAHLRRIADALTRAGYTARVDRTSDEIDAEALSRAVTYVLSSQALKRSASFKIIITNDWIEFESERFFGYNREYLLQALTVKSYKHFSP